MKRFPIGVIVDSFRVTPYEAVEKAARVGAQGMQVYACRGEMAPENLSAQARRDYLKHVKDCGLKISALCGDFGYPGFTNAEHNIERVERSKRILELACELETNIVTTHIGVVPEDQTSERFKVMQDACFQLAEYADSLNAHFAIETGPEVSTTLKAFLDTLHSTGVGVNLDPANLVMVTGDDPAKAVYNLKDYIVHTHAKDGNMLLVRDPELVYGPSNPMLGKYPSFEEVPLGEGSVNWVEYLTALEEIGYDGFLTIEREVGDDPEKDIIKAVNFLKGLMDE